VSAGETPPQTMVWQPRIGGAAALAASLGAFALCTTAASPQAAPSPTGGMPAPAPGVAPTPAPAGASGGTVAPAPQAAPPVPALEATVAQDVPLDEEGEEELELDVPPDRTRPERKAPDIPNLRSLDAAEPAAGHLAQTGVDARLLGSAGMFLIGVGLAMLAPTLPVRRL
jgi:hypothetical protein